MALNVKYLADADRLLADGDLSQASEKYWGAMADMVKAVAEKRSWRHHSHREIRQAVRLLADEAADREIVQLFAVGEALHANFYENFMTQEDVSKHSIEAQSFIDKLRSLTAA
jgi:hypothetical protein